MRFEAQEHSTRINADQSKYDEKIVHCSICGYPI
jgi:hypothetical protein